MQNTQFVLDVNEEIIADNFAGGGGASKGIEEALGRCVDIAINHDPEAIAMHEANHPQTKHFCESVWDVDPVVATSGRRVGLGWFSPDCFPAGTLVMTDKGYRAIETIQVGDMVLTHKLRWRAVTECSSTVRPLIEIRGHGHPGLLVSPEHPFYTRAQFRTWNNERRSYDHALRAPEWTPGSAVQKGLYWAAPCTFPESVVPGVAGRGIDMSDELLWLAGRYLGDGWTRLTDTRAEVVITCGMHEIERLRPLLNRWPRAGGRAGSNELEWHERTTSTTYQFTTSHRGLVEWLREHFGHRAEAKGVPAWALGLPRAAREALLEGYLSADGHKFDDFVEAHTVSKALAFGIKALANSLGKTVAVYCRPNSNVIQGREVNARDLFKARWRHAVQAEHTQTYIEDGIEWCPVREQSAAGEAAEVFNIGVDEDESYVVEGIIVHNCKHFSKAKGGKPVEKNIRGLAWVVLRWAALVRPRVIMLENVEEFKTWGPLIAHEVLGDDGEVMVQYFPDPKRKGDTFRSFVRQLQEKGYAVEHRELRACDFGTPTIRKRLFLIARCDGAPIVWPAPTHGAPDSEGVKSGRLLPWRTAAECIDWSLKCPSIFERVRPLAEATMKRIARGIKRYVVETADPYIVTLSHGEGKPGGAQRWGSGARPIADPFQTVTANSAYALVAPHITKFRTGSTGSDMRAPVPTITAGPKENPAGAPHALGVIMPFLTEHANGSTQRNFSANDPLRTQCAEVKGGHFALVAPALVQTGYGEREGQAPRSLDIEKPLGTVVAGGAKHALVSSFLAKHFGGHETPGASLADPISTITATDHHAQVVAQLVGCGGRAGQSRPRGVEEPAQTLTAKADTCIAASTMVKLRNNQFAQDTREPFPTLTAGGGHVADVRAFLVKYYSEGGQDQDVRDPMHTIPTKDRLGLVTVDGEDYVIADIGMRMLEPHELYAAQGFPSDYIVAPIINGKRLAKHARVRMCGNSVCPPLAAALVRANVPEMAAVQLRTKAKRTSKAAA